MTEVESVTPPEPTLDNVVAVGGDIKAELLKKAMPWAANMVFLGVFILGIQQGYISIGPALGGVRPSDIRAVEDLAAAQPIITAQTGELVESVRTLTEAVNDVSVAVSDLKELVAAVESNVVSAVAPPVRRPRRRRGRRGPPDLDVDAIFDTPDTLETP